MVRSRDQSAVTRQETLASPVGYTHGARGRTRTRWRDYIFDLAFSRFKIEPANFQKLLKTVRLFARFWAVTPRLSLKEM